MVILPFCIYYILNRAFLPFLDTLTTLIKYHNKVWTAAKMDLGGFIGLTQILGFGFQYIFYLFAYVLAAIYLACRIYKNDMHWRYYGMIGLVIYGFLMLKFKVTTSRILLGPQFQLAIQPALILIFVFLNEMYDRIRGIRRDLLGSKNLRKYITMLLIFGLLSSYMVFSHKRFYDNLGGWLVYQRNKRSIMPFCIIIPFTKSLWARLAIERAKNIIVPFKQAEEVSGVTEYIASVTKKDEPVFTFPEHGIYNFLADRPCVGRFNMAGFAWTSPKWQAELLQDLEKAKPRYVVNSRQLSNLAAAASRTEELLPNVREYLRLNYMIVKEFGSLQILKRIEN
jgi:hypothetical protein